MSPAFAVVPATLAQENFAASNVLPPPAGVYVSPAQWHAAYAAGVVIRDVKHRRFVGDILPPPPPGPAQVHHFNSILDLEVSLDGGATFNPVVANAAVAVSVVAVGGVDYQTEMLQLDVSGGTLPPNIRLRESPTQASAGQTSVSPVSGGYMIASFFDIFTELSTDGGATWAPTTNGPVHVELRNDVASVPPVTEPTNLLPPRNDAYVSPAAWHAAYAAGIIIKDVRHSLFTQSSPPPPAGGTNTHSFGSTVDFSMSQDGGATWQPRRANANVSVAVMNRSSSPTDQEFDTEMLMLNISGGDLPANVRLRESPTLPSRGRTSISPTTDGRFRIGSFFDIFTELSVDGGASYSPATSGPVRVQLVANATEQPFPSPDLPPAGEYISPESWHAYFAMGIVISNVSHNRFTQTQPPPPPGQTNAHVFNSQVEFDFSQDGGATFTRLSAPAAVNTRVMSRQDQGSTRYFDTEMLALNLSGGGLPPGVLIRESPTRSSVGRTSVRLVGAGSYRISSFFDIFPEVSTDGGATWSPSLSGPATVSVRPLGGVAVNITCSSNRTVAATGPSGAAVSYGAPVASGGCDPTLSVVCVPASGSTFPVGTTAVTCTASDTCGNTASCSFTVTVTPLVGDPCMEPDNGSGTVKLPPPGCQYLSPDQVHMIIDGLPPGTTIELAPIHKDFICHENSAGGVCSIPPGVSCEQPGGSLGGEKECSDSTLQLDLNGTGSLAGFNRQINIPLSFETHIAPRSPGQPVQSFDTDMFRMFGQITGDPDFDLLRIVGGTDFGLPSPGHTTLTRQPGGNWAVDSFFDITYRIDFVGAPGGPLAGKSGSTTATIRMVAVNSTPALSLVCPSNIIITASGAAGAMVSYATPVASGGVAPVTVSCVPPSGSTFPIGANVVVCTATDAAGGSVTCDFTVTVNPPVGDPCHEPDNGTGTVTLPPPGCVYLSPDEVHMIIDGLPPGTTIQLAAIHKDFICRQGGGTVCSNDCFTVDDCNPSNGATEVFDSAVSLRLTGTGLLAGWTRNLTIPNVFCQSQVGPRTPGAPVQSFSTEMTMIQGQLPPGDPDFDLLRITAGSGFGLPSPGHTTLTQLPGGNWAVDSFFDITYRIDFIGAPGGPLSGQSGSTTATIRMVANRALTLACAANQTVVATAPSGAVVNYPAPVASGGCPVSSLTCNPPTGSTFPIGTTPVTCVATDTCGNQATCGFSVIVRPPQPAAPEIFFHTNRLPPAAGVYVSPAMWHQLYQNGIVIRDVAHRKFTDNMEPPVVGSQTHTFGSQVDLEVSTDGGVTFSPFTAQANVAVNVTSTGPQGGRDTFDTEMLSLDVNGGNLPPGVLIRESPTRASTGRTTLRSVPGGYMISSFFDIFTEISLDGGQNWSPANEPAHVEVRSDPTLVPPTVQPTDLLPPPDGAYVSPQQWHAYYAQGIVIQNVSHSFFTGSLPPPPPGGTNEHVFDSQVDMQVSTDGGATFQAARAPASVQVRVMGVSSGGDRFFDTEMTSLDISGGDLPPAVRLRESPTLPSRGQTSIRALPDGTYQISSFFDIFTELSVDGGANWSPATSAPVRVELVRKAEENPPTDSPNLPPADGEYVSPDQWHQAYANGIIISNVSHKRFTDSQPPPPAGGSQAHDFGSIVELDVHIPGVGVQHAMANAGVEVVVTSSVDAGGTRFFDTEMTQLNLTGGTLPEGVLVRESPSKASLGRTSIRQSEMTATKAMGPGMYRVSSFFDIFTEISLDGGQTWSPAVSGPASVRLIPGTPVVLMQITCPADMVVNTVNPGGAVVTFLPLVINGDCPLLPTGTVTCTPPSGSTFPLGTTTVVCAGSNGCGEHPTCSFNVTVNHQPLAPVNEHFFRTNRLPPLDGVYISPQMWHQLYANGIIIRDVKHRRFVGNLPPPPPPGGSQVHQFDSLVELQVSTDGGNTFNPASGPAAVSVRVTDVGPSPDGGRIFDTEMLQLNLTGGTLPPGVMVRESPTRQSTGQTTVRQVPGGYMISSFFDIFTEISVNGGGQWSPANEPAHVDLRVDPASIPPVVTPTAVLPPLNDAYVSPAEWHAAYAQGIIIKDVSHSFFTHAMPPPDAGQSQVHGFDSHVDFKMSQDGGQTWTPGRAPAAVEVAVVSRDSSGGLFDTEMLTLNIQGGDLPAGIVLRESPTRQSGGGTQVDAQPDGSSRISSFFDIWTELSVDGGQNWSPATSGPVRVQLTSKAPEKKFPTPNLPPQGSEYISPQKWHALYAGGIIISNVSHRRFTENMPPPPPGGSQVHTFNSVVQFDLYLNNGGTFAGRFNAPAAVQARVTSLMDVGSTRYFDTEMLSLNIAGGGLPPSVMIRESPTKASLGRTSVRQTADGRYQISSFFDIFTELTRTGAGGPWTPSETGAASMSMKPITPKLTHAPQPGGQLRLQWPIEDTDNFVLRRTLDIGAPDWVPVDLPVGTNGPNRSITLPTGPASRGFFQLYDGQSGGGGGSTK